MKRPLACALLLVTCATLVALVPASAFAVDGTVLINQATVMAAGGFPYKITQPGSYKLSGNLTVATAVDAIDINCDNVTLDLNGFTITGPGPGIYGNFSGISSAKSNITVSNGKITGFKGGGGIDLVHYTYVGSAGINLTGSGDVIDRVTVSGNLVDLYLQQGGLVTNSWFYADDLASVLLSSFSNGLLTNNVIGSLWIAPGGKIGYGLNTLLQPLTGGGGTSLGNNACGSGTC